MFQIIVLKEINKYLAKKLISWLHLLIVKEMMAHIKGVDKTIMKLIMPIASY